MRVGRGFVGWLQNRQIEKQLQCNWKQGRCWPNWGEAQKKLFWPNWWVLWKVFIGSRLVRFAKQSVLTSGKKYGTREDLSIGQKDGGKEGKSSHKKGNRNCGLDSKWLLWDQEEEAICCPINLRMEKVTVWQWEWGGDDWKVGGFWTFRCWIRK